MVSRLVFDLLLILPFFKAETCSHKRRMKDHIDLVKGQPVVDQALVASEEGPTETFITFQHLATTPTSILGNQMHGTVKVGNGHQGFNAILMALLKEVFIEL